MIGFRGSLRIDERIGVRRLVAVGVAFSAALLLSCAHAHIERFDPQTGTLVCELESWVLGTGETEQLSSACGEYAYSTRDTGISDNGRDLAGALAAGAASGLIP